MCAYVSVSGELVFAGVVVVVTVVVCVYVYSVVVVVGFSRYR